MQVFATNCTTISSRKSARISIWYSTSHHQGKTSVRRWTSTSNSWSTLRWFSFKTYSWTTWARSDKRFSLNATTRRLISDQEILKHLNKRISTTKTKKRRSILRSSVPSASCIKRPTRWLSATMKSTHTSSTSLLFSSSEPSAPLQDCWKKGSWTWLRFKIGTIKALRSSKWPWRRSSITARSCVKRLQSCKKSRGSLSKSWLTLKSSTRRFDYRRNGSWMKRTNAMLLSKKHSCSKKRLKKLLTK